MLRQLFMKELRLQMSGIYFAFAVFLVAAMLSLLGTHSDYKITGDYTLGVIIGGFYTLCVMPCMMYVVPLFIGAATIAEERRLGVFDWQLSLPLSRFWQWVVKMGFAALLIVILACVVRPMMTHMMNLSSNESTVWIANLSPVTTLFYLQSGILVMLAGAFVSSLTSDPYKAFWGGVGVLVFLWLVASVATCGRFTGLIFGFSDGLVTVYAQIAYCALIAILGYNIYYHYRFEQMRWRRMAADLAGVALTIVLALGAIMFFTWVYTS